MGGWGEMHRVSMFRTIGTELSVDHTSLVDKKRVSEWGLF